MAKMGTRATLSGGQALQQGGAMPCKPSPKQPLPGQAAVEEQVKQPGEGGGAKQPGMQNTEPQKHKLAATCDSWRLAGAWGKASMYVEI